MPLKWKNLSSFKITYIISNSNKINVEWWLFNREKMYWFFKIAAIDFFKMNYILENKICNNRPKKGKE